MSEKLLITGASGFVGYHLIEEAVKQNYQVTAAIRRSSNISHLSSFPLSYVYLNLLDKPSLKAELEKGQYDYIIHNAGATKAASEEEYMEANALSTKNLAEAAAECAFPLKKFIFMSSLAASGPGKSVSGAPISELDPSAPVTLYGKSKLQAERYLSNINNLSYLSLRPTAVYGPREKDLLIVLKNINNGIETYIGSAAQKISFVYVKDLAALTVHSLASSVSGKAFLVSDGFSYDSKAWATTAKKLLRKKTLVIHVPVPVARGIASCLETFYRLFKKGTPVLNEDRINELTGANWTCNIDAAATQLGYQPQYDLEQGMKATITWYKENNWIN